MSINLATKARIQVGGLIVGNGQSDGGDGAIGALLPINAVDFVVATITPTASLLTDTVYETTVTFTGASLLSAATPADVTPAPLVPADAIIAIPPPALETGLVYDAFVSATNTIKVRIANPTGSTITTSARSWGFIRLRLI